MIKLISLLILLPRIQAAELPSYRTIDDQSLKWLPCPKIFSQGCELSVVHGHPSKKEADVFLRVPANYFIAPHWHHSAEHMVLLSGTMEVKYKGQGPIKLSTGSFAYGPARLPHQAKCISNEPCVLYINFDLPVDSEAYKGPL